MERIFVFSLGRQTQPLILQRTAGRLAWQGWGGKGVGVGWGVGNVVFLGWVRCVRFCVVVRCCLSCRFMTGNWHIAMVKIKTDPYSRRYNFKYSADSPGKE
ncbi:hypothetical protein CCL16_05440 [Pseudomonas syringae]|nr:hypothetical protein CCL21_12420 [Pseudomonas syringae]PBP92017.1 hypothetical protein CCL16_05440 [Pseudomonas syringae]